MGSGAVSGRDSRARFMQAGEEAVAEVAEAVEAAEAGEGCEVEELPLTAVCLVDLGGGGGGGGGGGVCGGGGAGGGGEGGGGAMAPLEAALAVSEAESDLMH